jgi:hypothetical protein
MAKRVRSKNAATQVAGAQVSATLPRDKFEDALNALKVLKPDAPIEKVNRDAFYEFLSDRLALYRELKESADAPLAPGEAHDTAAKIEAQIPALLEWVYLLAPDLDAEWMREHKLGFEKFLASVAEDLKEIARLASLTRKRSSRQAGRSGRQPTTYRDRLLHEVTVWLRQQAGLRKGTSVEVAVFVLNAANIGTPAARDAEKVFNKVAKQSAE